MLVLSLDRGVLKLATIPPRSEDTVIDEAVIVRVGKIEDMASAYQEGGVTCSSRPEGRSLPRADSRDTVNSKSLDEPPAMVAVMTVVAVKCQDEFG